MGDVMDSFICLSRSSQSHFLPCSVSWGLTYINLIYEFVCPLDSGLVWSVEVTGKISEGDTVWIFILQIPFCQVTTIICVTLLKATSPDRGPSLFSYPPQVLIISSICFFRLKDSNNSGCFVLGRYLLYFLLVSLFSVISLYMAPLLSSH